MQLSDITVEVRDKDLVRLGQIVPDYLDLTATGRFNAVGEWVLRLPVEHELASALRTPGAGIIVTGPGDVLFSGPVTNPVLETSPMDPIGTLAIHGVTDDVVLWDMLSIPQPSNPDLTTQNVAHDTRAGNAEDLLHAYVDANIGPSAPSERRKAGLTMGTNLSRGIPVKRSPRFPVLGDLLTEIALIGDLGFRVVQRGSELVFETFEIVDRTLSIRMDMRNGHLIGQKVAVSPPAVTRVLVAGQEEGVKRQFVARSTAESLAAESTWGRRIETFLDQRQTDDVDELASAGDKVLREGGFTSVAAQVVPAEDSLVEFGPDWWLGDRVSVVVDNQEIPNIVTGIVLKVSDQGFHLGAMLGDPTKLDKTASTTKRVKDAEDRLTQIETNAETTSIFYNSAFMQGGKVSSDDDTASVTFPIPYNKPPFVVASSRGSKPCTVHIQSTTATGCTLLKVDGEEGSWAANWHSLGEVGSDLDTGIGDGGDDEEGEDEDTFIGYHWPMDEASGDFAEVLMGGAPLVPTDYSGVEYELDPLVAGSDKSASLSGDITAGTTTLAPFIMYEGDWFTLDLWIDDVTLPEVITPGGDVGSLVRLSSGSDIYWIGIGRNSWGESGGIRFHPHTVSDYDFSPVLSSWDGPLHIQWGFRPGVEMVLLVNGAVFASAEGDVVWSPIAATWSLRLDGYAPGEGSPGVRFDRVRLYKGPPEGM